MNYKNVLALVLSLIMVIASVATVAAFWTPPEEPTPPGPPTPVTYNATFGVSIEDIGTDPGEYFNFTELEYGKCKNFTVQVTIFNVTDLFGYEFKLRWSGDWFELVDYEYAEYQDAIWGEDHWIATLPNDTIQLTQQKPYEQAVAAYDVEGKDFGAAVVAELTFHIVKDICWCEDEDIGWIWTEEEKMVDSLGQEMTIDPCLYVSWKYIPVQPKIYLKPSKITVSSLLPANFTVKVMVEDIAKMKSLHFRLKWEKIYIKRTFEKVRLPILSVKETDVKVNKAVFPQPNWTWTIDVGGDKYYQWLDFDLEMNQTYYESELVRGNFWVLRILFTKEDPWDANRQPEYYFNLTGKNEWKADDAITDIWFDYGYFDVLCPEKDYITFGKHSGICKDYGADSAPPSPEQPEFTPDWIVHPTYDYDTTLTPKQSRTISWAIDHATPGEVIRVDSLKPTTYYESGIVIDVENLTIYSRDGPENTIIDAGGASHAIYIQANGTTVKDFTITNANDRAIGVYQAIDTVKDVTIRNCKVTGNKYGIFIHHSTVANWTIVDCECTDNLHGFRADSGAVVNGLTVTNSKFSDNEEGGIMSYANIDGLTVTGGTFTNNGFGIMLGAESSTPKYIKNVDVTESTFNNNSKSPYGLGFWIYVYGSYYHEIENINVDDCSFTDNPHGVGFHDMVGWGYDDVVINATLNWWGDRRGPGGNAIFPESTGDNVTDNVLYDPWISCCIALHTDATYTFSTVEGDLDGDGKVTITDILIIAYYYGESPPPTEVNYYDLNKDGDIDITDVVIVCMHYTG